jgi:AcrR family transcriptional regulator
LAGGAVDSQTDGRRTGSKERIRSLALQLFTEQGYELTTLNQIADRLGMTRAAVLHHFSSKEALLTSSYGALLPELDLVLHTLGDGQRSTEGRIWAIERFASMVAGDHGRVLVCAQVNEGALRGIAGAGALRERLQKFTRAIAGDDTVEGRMRARLAVSVVVMADARGREVGGRLSERREAALRVARELIS